MVVFVQTLTLPVNSDVNYPQYSNLVGYSLSQLLSKLFFVMSSGVLFISVFSAIISNVNKTLKLLRYSYIKLNRVNYRYFMLI